MTYLWIGMKPYQDDGDDDADGGCHLSSFPVFFHSYQWQDEERKRKKKGEKERRESWVSIIIVVIQSYVFLPFAFPLSLDFSFFLSLSLSRKPVSRSGGKRVVMKTYFLFLSLLPLDKESKYSWLMIPRHENLPLSSLTHSLCLAGFVRDSFEIRVIIVSDPCQSCDERIKIVTWKCWMRIVIVSDSCRERIKIGEHTSRVVGDVHME